MIEVGAIASHAIDRALILHQPWRYLPVVQVTAEILRLVQAGDELSPALVAAVTQAPQRAEGRDRFRYFLSPSGGAGIAVLRARPLRSDYRLVTILRLLPSQVNAMGKSTDAPMSGEEAVAALHALIHKMRSNSGVPVPGMAEELERIADVIQTTLERT